MVSGVLLDTVLGPLVFLFHINDLPSVVSSKIRLFADDCLTLSLRKAAVGSSANYPGQF